MVRERLCTAYSIYMFIAFEAKEIILQSEWQPSRLRAVPLQSVESKLGRTGDSELAKRDTGEKRVLFFCTLHALSSQPTVWQNVFMKVYFCGNCLFLHEGTNFCKFRFLALLLEKKSCVTIINMQKLVFLFWQQTFCHIAKK